MCKNTSEKLLQIQCLEDWWWGVLCHSELMEVGYLEVPLIERLAGVSGCLGLSFQNVQVKET